MAMAIHFESRGESEQGQAGVGWVILNRVKDKGFPNDICKVIHQPHQFGFITRHLKVKDKREFEVSVRMAKRIISGKVKNPIGNRLYFNTYQMFKTKNKSIKVGKHVFF